MSAKIEIDGHSFEVRAGADLLSICLSQGVEIPYFCWHGALGSAGACRQCAIRLHDGTDDAEGRIVMACMTAAADGQRISVADPEAAAFRARVIEWLMVNHPHDCPVCEEAGSCHLQDMTVAAGRGVRRYRFTKRTHRNQDLGPLLTHEMNRCIACYRCTRFYRDYAGGRDLDVFGAHDDVYFGRARDGPLESPFAGNLAEVCPTGVFNDRGWSADYARKWDMKATPSVCPHCAVGCNLLIDERDGRVRRVQNRYHGALNGYFLCDRGRFGPLFVVSGARLVAPRIAGAAAPEDAAMDAARAALAAGAIGIGSPRASLEANFALRRLVGPDRFFAGVSDAEAQLVRRIAAILGAGPARIASLADIEAADAALVLGEDLTNAAPRMALALRQMARGAERVLAAQKGVPLWLDEAVRVAGEGRRSPITLATPAPDPLDGLAAHALRLDPPAIAAFGFAVAAALDGGAGDAEAGETARTLAAAERPLIIAGAGLGAAAIVESAAAVAAALGSRGRIALIPPEANSLGLSLFGGAGIEQAAALLASGAARTAIVLEADLFERAPHAAVERFFAAAETVVALDAIDTETVLRADVALPVAAFTEAAGTFVNYEGRAQRFFGAAPRAAPGAAPASWRRLAALGAGGWETLDAIIADLAAELLCLAGVAGAAPDASFRTAAGEVARTPRPFSGHTADDRAGRDPAATPPEDLDSALAWGMEGARAGVPPALISGYETPGLHSANAVTRFLEEINGPLRGGDPGALLISPGDGAAPGAPPVCAESGTGLWLAPLYDAFLGSETSRASPLLAARAPPPRLLLHPADAASIGLGEGEAALIDGRPCPARVALDAGLARGVVAITAGPGAPRGPLRRVTVEAAR
jgi:NADH-quinone oxidoreductase subunit G